jgi:NAD(P)-dependent dehydrogenase (short-subunit alcohol dehydrogenase family)
MPGQLEGRVALITGAGSGFGRASALRFAREGARLVVSDLSRESGEATAEIVRNIGGEAIAHQADVSDPASVAALFAAAVARFARIDCTFNNAGVLGPLSELHNYPLADFEKVMAVNVRGVWLCMQAAITQMLKQIAPADGHSIVSTASVAGLVGSPMLPAYSASKHAVIGLTRSAARQYGRHGIRINCVCPGPVETPLAGPLFDFGSNRQALLARQAIDRFAVPEEIAELVLWLSSPAASMVTGTPLRVDGGALS